MAGKKQTFPKIAAVAKLKKIIIGDTANLIFHKLQFSPNQYGDLERWRKNGDEIRLTLEQVQGELPVDDKLPIEK